MGTPESPSQDSSSALLRLILVCLALAAFSEGIHYLKLQALFHFKNYFWTTTLSLAATVATFLLIAGSFAWNAWVKRRNLESVTEFSEGSVYLGREVNTGTPVFLREDLRTLQAALNGATGTGKTGYVLEPTMVQDMEQQRGMIIIDGKADRTFLEQLYARAIQLGREKDFMVFSLAQPNLSSTFNPFAQGTAEQITERVFSSFTFTDEYYKAVQYSALRTVVSLLMARGQVPMPGVIRELLQNREKLKEWTKNLSDTNLASEVAALLNEDQEEFSKKYSGLVTALGFFSQGATAPLFNTRTPEIILSNIIRDRKICYFQLPTTGFPTLGPTTGKLVLQCLQSAVSEIQVQGGGRSGLFPVYLDDFNDFMYPEFISMLNKSRSAGIGVIFSHQSLGDLKKVGPDFAQRFLDNTNIKIIMRTPDPESAEYYAKAIGTKSAEKATERRSSFLWGLKRRTGEESVREVEQYVIHPNELKSALKLGRGVVIISHPNGRVVKLVDFEKLDRLPPVRLPVRDLPLIRFDREATAPDAKPRPQKGLLEGQQGEIRAKKNARQTKKLGEVNL